MPSYWYTDAVAALTFAYLAHAVYVLIMHQRARTATSISDVQNDEAEGCVEN